MRVVESVFGAGKQLIDGMEFIRCRFEGTTLVYSATAPTLLNECQFVGVQFEFSGPALLAFDFLRALGHGAGPDGARIVQSVIKHIQSPPPPPPPSLSRIAETTATSSVTIAPTIPSVGSRRK